jgi:hypothetical protein
MLITVVVGEVVGVVVGDTVVVGEDVGVVVGDTVVVGEDVHDVHNLHKISPRDDIFLIIILILN